MTGIWAGSMDGEVVFGDGPTYSTVRYKPYLFPYRAVPEIKQIGLRFFPCDPMDGTVPWVREAAKDAIRQMFQRYKATHPLPVAVMKP